MSRLGEGATRGSASVSVGRFAISILMQAEDSMDAALYASRQGKTERRQRQPRMPARGGDHTPEQETHNGTEKVQQPVVPA